jgi:hypothetical protein
LNCYSISSLVFDSHTSSWKGWAKGCRQAPGQGTTDCRKSGNRLRQPRHLHPHLIHTRSSSSSLKYISTSYQAASRSLWEHPGCSPAAGKEPGQVPRTTTAAAASPEEEEGWQMIFSADNYFPCCRELKEWSLVLRESG